MSNKNKEDTTKFVDSNTTGITTSKGEKSKNVAGTIEDYIKQVKFYKNYKLYFIKGGIFKKKYADIIKKCEYIQRGDRLVEKIKYNNKVYKIL